ncbi:hypothetical protein AXK11_06190 [Cephaloticoccus primus]|uniref:PIN domain-containing protein n=1 Tax=Cephaloticoccus primus TaxID=1548207 RepID=A0A139SLZ4_9BACT|nr:type II toxin-antitoxin system VapC family toxin [Cephaloticoccus primus]KXU35572.1 hypothetical protein AXK11_06190 [Cephaloticoccus primus]
MKAVVIDPSVSVSWGMEDEQTPFSAQLLTEIHRRAFLPITIPLFWYELRSVMINNVRRGRVRADKVSEFLRYMHTLGIATRTTPTDDEVCALAYRYQLTGYDASYLALAVSERAILATNDQDLARAAFAEGLELRTLLAPERYRSGAKGHQPFPKP